MTIVAARIHSYRLRFRAALETAHGRLLERRGFLLELENRDGVIGWGDACPIEGFGMESLPRCERALAVLGQHAIGRDAESDTSGWLEWAGAVAPDAPGACGALDVALNDIGARTRGVAVAEHLSCVAPCRERESLAVSALVVGDDPQALERSAMASVDEGFRTFKLKLGARAWSEDRARVQTIRDVIGPDARLRLDANGAFDEDEARAVLGDLADLDIELIEQPVAAPDIEALARLRAACPIPIAADEAVASVQDAERVLALGAADVLVLKPAALGGPTRALAVARAAHEAGCTVFVTSLLDSALGVAAAVQVAAALPGPRPADGLATGVLFEEDVARTDAIVRGRMPLPTGPGLGLIPDPASLVRLRCGPSREIRS